jgi:hypothetical protein
VEYLHIVFFKDLVDEAYEIFAGAANLEEEIDTI